MVEVKPVFPINRSKFYALGSLVNISPQGYHFLSTNLHVLMHICLVVVPRQIIPFFSIFQYVKELDNFPRWQRKYTKMGNIVKLV